MSAEMNLRIGRRLKLLRNEKGWSLAACAAQTGVSKAMLGQIERGESSPTIATLWKIASGLTTSFSSFLVSQDHQPFSHEEVLSDAAKMRVETLFPYQADVGMETFKVNLAIGHKHQSSAHQQGVIEHIIMLRGSLRLSIAEGERELHPGDRLRFNADQAHDYENIGDCEVEFHNIVCYCDPLSRDC